MRIGHWLGGSVIVVFAAVHGMSAAAQAAEHVTTVPLGRFIWKVSRAIITSASTFRRDSAASSQINNDRRQGCRAQAAHRRAAHGQRPGHRL